MATPKPLYGYILVAAGIALIVLSLFVLLSMPGPERRFESFAFILIGPIPLILSGENLSAAAAVAVLALLAIIFLAILLRRRGG
jgi:uncharacterized membrane protein